MSEDTARKVVLTCAQPTGQLHLGNYFGAVRHWVSLIEDHECFYGIVDQHAITVPYVPADLRKSVYNTLAIYMACGLDPEKCHLFLQSQVRGHTDLAWILGCLCPIGQLERMTQFKDKAQRQQTDSVGAGLLYYPVLMAADILIYNADLVPVGEDQKQHLELCRDLAQKFNTTYSPTFKVPDPSIPKSGGRIRSLQNPQAKMSKSDPQQAGCLYLLDPPDVIRKKIRTAVTDSETEIRLAPEKPGVSNLLTILSLASGKSIENWETELQGQNYGALKEATAEAVVTMLQPIQERFQQLVSDKAHLDNVFKQGREAAQVRANRLMSKVFRKVGFIS